MEIKTSIAGNEVTVTTIGCLDTTTSTDFQRALTELPAGTKSLHIDFSNLEYISSAGFRVLLTIYKKLKAEGGAMDISGVNQTVREVFEMTGFADIFTLL